MAPEGPDNAQQSLPRGGLVIAAYELNAAGDGKPIGGAFSQGDWRGASTGTWPSRT
jgi:hypothetical protein